MAKQNKNALMDAPDVLKKIGAYKAEEVAALKKNSSITALRAKAAAQPSPRGFAKTLKLSLIHI